MRQFAKSLFRLSWAMTLLGLRQATRVVAEGWSRSARPLDEVSHSAAAQLGPGVRRYYRAGDELQKGLLDAAADLASGAWSDPRDGLRKGLRETWESVDRSWSTLRKDR